LKNKPQSLQFPSMAKSVLFHLNNLQDNVQQENEYKLKLIGKLEPKIKKIFFKKYF